MSQLDRRGVLRLFAALGAGGVAMPVLAACSGGTGADSDDNEPSVVNTGPPIKVGMVVPQTGALKPFGDEMANGFQLYLRQNGNKLGGRSVTLISVDEGESADSSRAAAEKLLKQERVVALTGVANSAGMLAMKDLVESSQTPLIGSNASPANLGGVYIWRTSFIPSEPSKALGGYLATNGGQVAVVTGNYNGDGASQDEIKAFFDSFTAGNGHLAGTTHVTSLSSKNYADTFTAIRNSGATSMFAYYTGANAVDFVKQAAAFNFGANFQVYGPGALTEGPLLKQQGSAASNVFTAMNYSPDLDNPANRRFVADYQKAFQIVPSAYAVASYDAAMVIDKAIDGVETDLTAQSLNAALGRLGQVDSPRGPWQFTASRAPLQKWYLRQVRKDGMVLSNVLTAELTTLG